MLIVTVYTYNDYDYRVMLLYEITYSHLAEQALPYSLPSAHTGLYMSTHAQIVSLSLLSSSLRTDLAAAKAIIYKHANNTYFL